MVKKISTGVRQVLSHERFNLFCIIAGSPDRETKEMAFGAGKPISSGIFRYQYQQQALSLVTIELIVCALGCGLYMESVGAGVIAFLALMAMLFIPYIRMILVMAISGMYAVLAIVLLGLFGAKENITFGWLDWSGIAFAAFLISFGVHAFFLDWAKDAAED